MCIQERERESLPPVKLSNLETTLYRFMIERWIVCEESSVSEWAAALPRPLLHAAAAAVEADRLSERRAAGAAVTASSTASDGPPPLPPSEAGRRASTAEQREHCRRRRREKEDARCRRPPDSLTVATRAQRDKERGMIRNPLKTMLLTLN